MKHLFLIAAAAILLATSSSFADVKIKTKQTISGQASENTTFIKGKRTRTEMMNGMMISITQCDLARDLQLNPQTRTYMVNLYDDGTVSEPVKVDTKTTTNGPVQKGGTMFVTTTIKDTGERKQMFGFTARHIIQTVETETTADACNPTKTKMEMDMWVIDAEFGAACLNSTPYRNYRNGSKAGCSDKIVPKTIGTAKSGYPLYQKMTMFDASGKETATLIQEVVELSKTTLDQALFEAPADYREVKDSAQLYAAAALPGNATLSSNSSANSASGASYGQPSSMAANVQKASEPSPELPAAVGPKRAGTIRIGVAVKTTSVGDGITAQDLSLAIQNTIGQFMKGTKVEVVPLEARLAAAVTGEAKEKECDFVLSASAAHKKGGGGFGFGKMLGQVVAQTGIGHTGSVAGNIAGQMATTAIVTATSVSDNVKNKDELTLDTKLQSVSDGSSPLAKQFKAKAKSDGDDIISAVVEQAAQAILDAIGR